MTLPSLIDAHCHLAQLNDQELQLVLQNAKDNGVEHLVAIGAGYGFEDNVKTLELAKNFEQISCALAMHPHDAKDVNDDILNSLKNMILQNPNVKAVGEIGLDYHYLNSEIEVQKKVLLDFIQIALETKKPVIIHDRDCEDDCVNLLKDNGIQNVGGVVHCFTGTKELAKRYLDLGFYISFTGIITFKNAQDLRDVVKMVPIEKMMVETDSPFLAPVPKRGKKNEPSYVRYVAEEVAKIKGLSIEDVAKITSKNAKDFFKIH